MTDGRGADGGVETSGAPPAARTPLRKVTWREGTKGKLSGRFAWLRVWPGQGWSTGQCATAGPIWLLIEEQADGTIEYAFSNLPASTSRIRAAPSWSGQPVKALRPSGRLRRP